MDSKHNQYPPLTFSVPNTDAGKRLDAFLALHIEGWSRARLQRLIEAADVLVNGQVAKSSYKLHPNDQIEVELTPPLSTAFAPENIALDIVFEDDDLIVVNKPAGMVVHPAAGVDSGTLANALAFHFTHLSRTAGATRPGIVHRLDKGTSGLLVVAKMKARMSTCPINFAREVFKSYLALVHGQVENESGEIDQPIARDPSNRIRMAIVRGGRPSVSIYQVRKRFDRFTLLDVELKTGRTHQIRVHLSWMKYPVVGDKVYGGGRDNTVVDVRIRTQIASLGRQFLHAEKLGFHHPRSGEELRFVAQPPPDLQKLLEELK